MLEALLSGSTMRAVITQLPKPASVLDIRINFGMCLGPGGLDLYVIGGQLDAGVMNKNLMRYNIATKVWTKLAGFTLSDVRWPMFECVGNQLIYIRADVVYIYTISTNTWVAKTGPATASPYNGFGSASIVYGNYMHIFNNPRNGNPPTLARYDHVTNTFTTVATYGEPTTSWVYVTGELIGTRFYVVGSGLGAGNDLIWYDMVTKIWGSSTYPISNRKRSAASYNGNLYIFGADTTYMGVLKYNPTTDAFVRLPDTQGGQASTEGVIAINDLAYCFGTNGAAPADLFTYKLF